MNPVVCLCTGNATRSVLAEVLLRDALDSPPFTSAGTLVVEGQPISWRTRAAFESIDVPPPHHRGRQATEAMVNSAPLVLAAAPEHVGWVRRVHPAAASRTVTIKRAVRALHDWRGGDDLAEFLAWGRFGTAVLEDWEEIIDPGGQEVDAYVACAAEVRDLVEELAPLLGPLLGAPPP